MLGWGLGLGVGVGVEQVLDATKAHPKVFLGH